MPDFRSAEVTRREAEVLGWMAAFPDEYLIYERGDAYFGTERVAARVVFSLIRSMRISSAEGGAIGKVEHYRINETGREALADHLGIQRRGE